MASKAKRVSVDVEGRSLSLSNLDKVLYPEVGFTKAQVIDYYVRIAPAMLPHISDRGLTLRRFPDGVDGQSFFEKRCAGHRPSWLQTAAGPGDRGGVISYCRLTEPAALAWTANMAALELHAPMARCRDVESPTMLVFDLDPGAPATIIECASVALSLREVLAAVGLEGFPKTSGSKGMQVYVPLNLPHTHDHVSSFALAVGQLLTKQRPKDVLVNMNKSERKGKILVDWSQNSRHKTTVAVYSLRARPTPTVSTPVSWDEVMVCADGEALSFVTDDVLGRVAEFGDLFAPTLELEQQIPTPSA
jgi:bifunctional non-homologous end joining protein LigD